MSKNKIISVDLGLSQEQHGEVKEPLIWQMLCYIILMHL